MGLRGPKRSLERIELEGSECTTCNALPGQSCLTPSGHPQGSKMVHAPRRKELERKELEIIRR